MYEGFTHPEPRKTTGKKYVSEYECEIHRAGNTMAAKCVKGCSASLVSGEFKLKQK